MTEFLAQDGGVDLEFLRDLLREFVAHDAAGDALDVRQEIVHRFVFAFGAADGKLRACALDQVVEVFLRVAQGLTVGVLAFAADVEVGIESLLEGEDLDLEFFFDEQAQSTLGGLCSGRVGVEVHDYILAEAAEQLGLQLGEGGTGAGDDILESGGEDGDAIHLAFDEDGIVELLDPFLGELKVEQDTALGVDRRLGRVQIFWSGLFVGGESAPGERYDFARFAGDREHDAVAELGVHRGELRAASFEWLGFRR